MKCRSQGVGEVVRRKEKYVSGNFLEKNKADRSGIKFLCCLFLTMKNLFSLKLEKKAETP